MSHLQVKQKQLESQAKKPTENTVKEINKIWVKHFVFSFFPLLLDAKKML